jgi:nicotinamidase-related amidase
MLPAAGQGALGIESRSERPDVAAALAPLAHQTTWLCVAAERAVSRAMGGSCSMPLAAHAHLEGEYLQLSAAWGDPDQAGVLVRARGAEIVADLAPLPTEHVVRKRRPSAFFETDLDVFLRGYRADTLILAGSSMSGCVRATATDAFSRDYRTMIVAECVIDRTQELCDRNLFDLDAKYCDAVSLDETLAYLKQARLSTDRPLAHSALGHAVGS